MGEDIVEGNGRGCGSRGEAPSREMVEGAGPGVKPRRQIEKNSNFDNCLCKRVGSRGEARRGEHILVEGNGRGWGSGAEPRRQLKNFLCGHS
jgi:hypothetical protein